MTRHVLIALLILAGGRAEALRRSQLALASDKDTSHPFFWAPFVLVGDGGPTGP